MSPPAEVQLPAGREHPRAVAAQHSQIEDSGRATDDIVVEGLADEALGENVGVHAGSPQDVCVVGRHDVSRDPCQAFLYLFL